MLWDNKQPAAWLVSEGFGEVGVTADYNGQYTPKWPSLTGAQIRAAGIPLANLDWFNDYPNPGGPGVSGASLAGDFNAAANAGWNTCGGEGVGGSVMQYIENYMIGNNLAGDVGGYQMDAYSGQFSQPKSGGKGHTDYIETYVGGTTQCASSTIQRIQEAKSYGSIYYGPLIEDYSVVIGWGSQYYIDIIKQSGANAVFFWGGYSASSAGLQGDLAQIYSDIKGTFGITKGSPTAASGGKTTAAAAAKPAPVVHCPCKHIQLSFANAKGNSTSQHIEFKEKITGVAGYIDDNDHWIAHKPYTGKLEAWCRDSKNKSWKLFDFYPAKDGTFAFIVGSDTAEQRYYNVCIADPGPIYSSIS